MSTRKPGMTWWEQLPISNVPWMGPLEQHSSHCRYSLQNISSFSVHFQQSQYRQETIYRYQSKVKKEEKKTPYHLVLSNLFGLFCVCSSMSSLPLTSSTIKHTFDTQHKWEQRLNQRPCFFLLLFCLVLLPCFLFEVSGFFSYYFTWLICLEMPLLYCSTRSSIIHCPTHIYRNPFMRLAAR